MSEFKYEDLDSVIEVAESSLAQMLALQLKNTMQKLNEATLECDVIRDQVKYWNDKCRVVTAENAVLRSPELVEFLRLVECMISDHIDGNYGNSHSWIRHIVQAQRVFTDKYEETAWGVFGGSGFPATDAIINALRVEGVEMYASALKQKFDAIDYSSIGEYRSDGEEDKVSDYGDVDSALIFATQLRNGEHDKDGEE